MKKLILSFLAGVAMLMGSTTILAQTAIAPSGSGTSGNPYQIATLENLYWIEVNKDIKKY